MDKNYIGFFCSILIIFVLFMTFGIASISGSSMEPTLHNGELIVTQKLFMNFKPGDIVIANVKDIIYDTEKVIIKRIIATEGQTLEIINGKVYVDNIELDEAYIKELVPEDNYEKITIPKGEVFVMGDNRNNSNDSRSIGTIKTSDIKAKLIYILK